jgi:hypothetical protein
MRQRKVFEAASFLVAEMNENNTNGHIKYSKLGFVG